MSADASRVDRMEEDPMKLFFAGLVAVTALSIALPAAADPGHHHHRHQVCERHHHHRVCSWR